MKKSVSSLWQSKSSLAAKQFNSESDLLDVSEIDEHLGITEAARQQGSANLPHPQSQTLSSTETQIVQTIERHRQKKFDQTMLDLQKVQNDIAQLNELPDLQNVWLIETNFEREATQLVSEQSQLIRSLASNAQKRCESFKDSKNKIRSKGSPSTPAVPANFFATACWCS
jgi:hypothetical protein